MSDSRASATTRGSGRRVAFLPIVIGLVAAGVLGALGALGLATAELSNWGQWTRDFAKSPGAAAFVALIAACIAYAGLSKQVEVSRAALQHQQSSTQDASWWAMFEWASGRALPAVPEHQALPDEITISTLQRLAEEATSHVQQTACRGIVDFLVSRLPDDPVSLGTVAEEDGARNTIITTLQQYIDATTGTAAASGTAEAMVYKNNVLKALLAFTFGSTTIKLDRQSNRHGADALMYIEGREVMVLIKWVRMSDHAVHAVRDAVDRIRRSDKETPLLVITPFAVQLFEGEDVKYRAVAAKWKSPNDGGALLEAAHLASVS